MQKQEKILVYSKNLALNDIILFHKMKIELKNLKKKSRLSKFKVIKKKNPINPKRSELIGIYIKKLIKLKKIKLISSEKKKLIKLKKRKLIKFKKKKLINLYKKKLISSKKKKLINLYKKKLIKFNKKKLISSKKKKLINLYKKKLIKFNKKKLIKSEIKRLTNSYKNKLKNLKKKKLINLYKRKLIKSKKKKLINMWKRIFFKKKKLISLYKNKLKNLKKKKLISLYKNKLKNLKKKKPIKSKKNKLKLLKKKKLIAMYKNKLKLLKKKKKKLTLGLDELIDKPYRRKPRNFYLKKVKRRRKKTFYFFKKYAKKMNLAKNKNIFKKIFIKKIALKSLKYGIYNLLSNKRFKMFYILKIKQQKKRVLLDLYLNKILLKNNRKSLNSKKRLNIINKTEFNKLFLHLISDYKFMGNSKLKFIVMIKYKMSENYYKRVGYDYHPIMFRKLKFYEKIFLICGKIIQFLPVFNKRHSKINEKKKKKRRI